ncbi:hypothetical protein F5878DRAFT_603285 [Lentinula raphanica]|uniref:Uncharacterized protein n=1 Tax=Lentinula raphanica TaxID=153919 RepID=A0AA38UKC0_9AGAR|nr:hypothetical protein F5878DRAFT_603285 [Lentinula raphanica]
MNMERRNRTEVQGTKRARDNAGPASKELPAAKHPRFMPDIIEKLRSRIGPVEVRIHDGLWDLAKHHRYLHLALFTDRNLTFINNHWTSFKSAKVLIGATKTTLPVLKDITDQLGLPDPEVDSTEGLSYPSFQQAVKNYYSFEKECDKNGAEGTRARWTQNHFIFFVNQHNAEAYYHFWKPREYRLRMERQDYDLGFEIGSYEMQWALVEEEARCHFDSTTPKGSYSPHHSSDTDVGRTTKLMLSLIHYHPNLFT